METKPIEKRIDEIARNEKNFRTIQPEKVMVLNARGEKRLRNLLDNILQEIIDESL